MVEPFARAAFALKPYQVSDPVTTEFGVHLIMAVDHKPGKDVKFEDVKPFVQEVYGDRLREAILTSYKAKSQIVDSRKEEGLVRRRAWCETFQGRSHPVPSASPETSRGVD